LYTEVYGFNLEKTIGKTISEHVRICPQVYFVAQEYWDITPFVNREPLLEHLREARKTLESFGAP